MFFVYMVRCADGSYYTGYTDDPARRTAVHNSGKGARYTRSRRPVTLCYTERYETKREAMSREISLKRLTHAEKEALASGKS